MKTINALTLRKKLESTLDEVHNKKIPIVISRANKPLVVMIPFEDYKEIKDEKERERRLRSAASKIDQWREKNMKGLKGLNSVGILRQIREER